MVDAGAVILAIASGAAGIFAATGALKVAIPALKEIAETLFGRVELAKGHFPHSEEEKSKLEELRRKFEHKQKSEITPIELPTIEDRPPVEASSPRSFAPFIALVLVILVFALAVGTVWALTHIGGPIEATIKATLAQANGSIALVGGGLFAAFFGVAIMAFLAIRVFTDRF